jgi:hypothetical protein
LVQQKLDPRNVKYILNFQFKWDHNELDLKLIMNDYLCEITKTQITLNPLKFKKWNIFMDQPINIYYDAALGLSNSFDNQNILIFNLTTKWKTLGIFLNL